MSQVDEDGRDVYLSDHVTIAARIRDLASTTSIPSRDQRDQ